MASLMQIPEECLLVILARVDLQSLCQVSATCQYMRMLIKVRMLTTMHAHGRFEMACCNALCCGHGHHLSLAKRNSLFLLTTYNTSRALNIVCVHAFDEGCGASGHGKCRAHAQHAACRMRSYGVNWRRPSGVTRPSTCGLAGPQTGLPSAGTASACATSGAACAPEAYYMAHESPSASGPS